MRNAATIRQRWVGPKLAARVLHLDLAAAGDFMRAHKWKCGAGETEATVKEIRRKASKIAPAYNKGALQYLPDD